MDDAVWITGCGCQNITYLWQPKGFTVFLYAKSMNFVDRQKQYIHFQPISRSICHPGSPHLAVRPWSAPSTAVFVFAERRIQKRRRRALMNSANTLILNREKELLSPQSDVLIYLRNQRFRRKKRGRGCSALVKNGPFCQSDGSWCVADFVSVQKVSVCVAGLCCARGPFSRGPGVWCGELISDLQCKKPRACGWAAPARLIKINVRTLCIKLWMRWTWKRVSISITFTPNTSSPTNTNFRSFYWTQDFCKKCIKRMRCDFFICMENIMLNVCISLIYCALCILNTKYKKFELYWRNKQQIKSNS